MTIEGQANALLKLVETDRAEKCSAILGEARERASAILAAAHRNARQRVRDALNEERQRVRERIAAARARQQNRRRLHEQRGTAALLTVAWEKLPLEMLRRWQDGNLRKQWTMLAVGAARALLPRAGWIFQHPGDWPAVEQHALADGLARELGAAPQFAPDAGVRAGLRIRAGSNVVDASLDGLLIDRTAVGARLLTLLAGETR